MGYNRAKHSSVAHSEDTSVFLVKINSIAAMRHDGVSVTYVGYRCNQRSARGLHPVHACGRWWALSISRRPCPFDTCPKNWSYTSVAQQSAVKGEGQSKMMRGVAKSDRPILCAIVLISRVKTDYNTRCVVLLSIFAMIATESI